MLQKNVLDYLDSSAARFPHKLAFADEARSFTFGQLRACARGLGTALADLGPQHNRPVAVLVNHTAANLAAFFGVLEAGHFYVPLDLQMPLPRLRGILETLSPAALVYPAGEETLAQALADLCPVLCAEEGFAHPPPGRPAGCPPGAGAGHRPGVRHFHLRLHRHPQGDRHRPPQRH